MPNKSFSLFLAFLGKKIVMLQLLKMYWNLKCLFLYIGDGGDGVDEVIGDGFNHGDVESCSHAEGVFLEGPTQSEVI